VSWLGDDLKATVVIGSMVALSTLIRFVQEAAPAAPPRPSRPGQQHRHGVAARPGAAQAQAQERPIRELVPGDCLQLSAGDMIPADCRVLGAGPVRRPGGHDRRVHAGGKFAAQARTPEAHGGALEQRNLLFMGTNVVSGSATAVVLATGNRSYFGTLAAHRATARAR
jgi:Mg2+-importing ATPase